MLGKKDVCAACKVSKADVGRDLPPSETCASSILFPAPLCLGQLGLLGASPAALHPFLSFVSILRVFGSG